MDAGKKHDPTPEEIIKRAAEIREGWEEDTFYYRSGRLPPHRDPLCLGDTVYIKFRGDDRCAD